VLHLGVDIQDALMLSEGIDLQQGALICVVSCGRPISDVGCHGASSFLAVVLRVGT
jgi:hypothetical protein